VRVHVRESAIGVRVHPHCRDAHLFSGAMTDDNEDEVARTLARGTRVICLPFVPQLFPDHRDVGDNRVLLSARP